MRLRFGKKFSSLLEAEAFACGCHHIKYEKSFIDFCVELGTFKAWRFFQRF